MSVLENILVDAVDCSLNADTTTDDKEVVTYDNAKIHADVLKVTIEVSDIIKAIGVACPNSKLAVMAPLVRPSAGWYTEHFETLLANCKIGIGNLTALNPAIVFLEPFAREAQVFGTDGVHLTSESAKIFLNSMIVASENHFLSMEEFGRPDIKLTERRELEEMEVGLGETTSSWNADPIDKVIRIGNINTRVPIPTPIGADLTLEALSGTVKQLHVRIEELEKVVGSVRSL